MDRMISLRMPESDVERLNKLAADVRRSRSAVVRELIRTAKVRIRDVEAGELAEVQR